MFGGRLMDSFMDKLAQKLTAQEMIKGNLQAEADEMDMLKKEVSEYRKCLKEISEVSDKVAKSLQDSADATDKKVKEALDEITNEAVKKIEEAGAKDDENVHRECVKVYRNVQASIIEENKKSVDEIAIHTDKVADKASAALVFAILSMVASLGTLGLLIFNMFF